MAQAAETRSLCAESAARPCHSFLCLFADVSAAAWTLDRRTSFDDTSGYFVRLLPWCHLESFVLNPQPQREDR